MQHEYRTNQSDLQDFALAVPSPGTLSPLTFKPLGFFYKPNLASKGSFSETSSQLSEIAPGPLVILPPFIASAPIVFGSLICLLTQRGVLGPWTSHHTAWHIRGSDRSQRPPREIAGTSWAGPWGPGCLPAGSVPTRASNGLVQMMPGFTALPGRGWDGPWHRQQSSCDWSPLDPPWWGAGPVQADPVQEAPPHPQQG